LNTVARKISTTVYMTSEQDARLRALSLATRVPMAEWIRDGIDLVIERERARGDLPEGSPSLGSDGELAY
jgi:hypothetical protein